MNEAPEPFGRYIKRLRESRGLTLRDVERITSGMVSNAYLSQLENGRVETPGLVMLHRLSAAYAVEFGHLCERALAGNEPMPPTPVCSTCGQVLP